jgi:hypothetical protein
MENNPYQSPKQQSTPATDQVVPSLLANTTSMFLLHLFLLIAIGLVLIFVVPSFEKMFVDFEIKLPPPTLLILAISRLAVNYWYLAIIVAPLYFLFLLGIQSLDRHIKGFNLGWAILFWLSAALFLVVGTLAIAMPLLTLTFNLSK